MTRLFCILLIIAFATPAAPVEVRAARILSVYDGDTATVDLHVGQDLWRHGVKLRFMCVDTPELRGDERARGLEVRDLVRSWLPPGTHVTIEDHGTGKFGRTLAVITPEGWGESVNARLFRLGHARIEAYTDTDRAACERLLRGG